MSRVYRRRGPRPGTTFGRWTAAELTRLRLLFPSGSPAELRNAIPNRSLKAMAAKAHGLGINRASQWSAVEVATLRRLYPRAAWDEILEQLPYRSSVAITTKARDLGIKRKYRTSDIRRGKTREAWLHERASLKIQTRDMGRRGGAASIGVKLAEINRAEKQPGLSLVRSFGYRQDDISPHRGGSAGGDVSNHS